jgi:hypothetical protein
MLVTIALVLLVGIGTSGCGDEAGPAGSGVIGGRPASDIGVGNDQGIIDRLFGDSGVPSRAVSDVSIDDSVPANYATVPGASTLDNVDTVSLDVDDDPFDEMRMTDFESGDIDLDSSMLDEDPMDSVSDINWDSANTDSMDTYGAGIDDVGMEFGDPGMDPGMGMDDPMLDDPMMGDPMMDDPMLDF